MRSYVVKSVRMETRKIQGKWRWRLVDYIGAVIIPWSKDGYKTKAIATQHVREAKTAHQNKISGD